MTVTFSQHMALARSWCRYNGQKGTDNQALKIMCRLSADVLVRMLSERGLTLPIGVVAIADAVQK